jgi:hypothetical protein
VAPAAPAWAEVLDQLEADVAAVEAMLRDKGRTGLFPPWSAPAGLGPLPAELRERAGAVLERHLAASLAVVAALSSTGRQVIVAGRLRSHDVPAPSYLDRSD